jgi:hypothetical protein
MLLNWANCLDTTLTIILQSLLMMAKGIKLTIAEALKIALEALAKSVVLVVEVAVAEVVAEVLEVAEVVHLVLVHLETL